jgi:hypothetical protein
MKSKQFALLTPVYWDLEREAHQLFGGKLRRVLAVDDGGDNVRRQQGKTQEPGDVTASARSTCGEFFPPMRRITIKRGRTWP